MRYLCQGLESRDKMELLLKLCNHGEATKTAFIDHFTRDMSVSGAAMLNGLKPGNLSRSIKELNAIAEINEKLFELKIYQPTDINKKV